MVELFSACRRDLVDDADRAVARVVRTRDRQSPRLPRLGLRPRRRRAARHRALLLLSEDLGRSGTPVRTGTLVRHRLRSARMRRPPLVFSRASASAGCRTARMGTATTSTSRSRRPRFSAKPVSGRGSGRPYGQGRRRPGIARTRRRRRCPTSRTRSNLLRPAGPSKPLASCLRSLAIACITSRTTSWAPGRCSDNRRPWRRPSGTCVAPLRCSSRPRNSLSRKVRPTRPSTSPTPCCRAANAIRRQTVLGLTNLAAYLLAADRIEDARLIARNTLHEAIALDWRAAIVRLVEHLALVAVLTEQTANAARMLGYSVAFTRPARQAANIRNSRPIIACSPSCLRPCRSMACSGSWPKVQNGAWNRPRKTPSRRRASRPEASDDPSVGIGELQQSKHPRAIETASLFIHCGNAGLVGRGYRAALPDDLTFRPARQCLDAGRKSRLALGR